LTAPEFTYDQVYTPLLHYHLHKIQQFSLNKYKNFRFELPSAVCNTACCLFARFYCQYSFLQYRPSVMISVCLYMACKLEEHYIKVDDFVSCKEMRTNSQQTAAEKIREIHALEPVLLQGVNYSMRIWQPLRALKGFMQQFKLWQQQQQQSDDNNQAKPNSITTSTANTAPPVTVNAAGRATRRRRISKNEQQDTTTQNNTNVSRITYSKT
jgi:hypothetical protein